MRYTINNRPELLAIDDEVVFTVNGREMHHHITRGRLYFTDGVDREIFDVLEIEDRFAFAEVVYGYEPRYYCFPDWKTDDFAAATRLVNALFDVIEGREKAGVGKVAEAPAPAPEPRRFKTGDRVRVKASVKTPTWGWGAVKHGDVGVVRHVGGRMAVDFPAQEDWTAEPEEMELVEDTPAPAPEAPAPKFKVGDRVRLTDDTEAPLQVDGALGEIIEIDAGDARLPYLVEWNDGDTDWMPDGSFKLVEDAPAPDAPARDTLQEFLESLPGDLRKLVEKIRINGPKIRAFVFAASAKDGEEFASGAITMRYRGTTTLDRKSIAECAGLASVLLWREQALMNAEDDR